MIGYYIYFGTNSSGVLQKIGMQIDKLKNVADVKLIKAEAPQRNLIKKIAARMPWNSLGYDYNAVLSQIENPDFIYVRRTAADKAYVDFFAVIKKKYSSCKIIVEIFTYPYYKDEFNRNIAHRIESFPFWIKEKHYRKYLHMYVDRFVTYSNDAEIYGIPTIQTANGINVDEITRVKRDNSSDDSTINLVSVAHMQVHHGYERLIEGIRNYYRGNGTKNILYHVVGDGSELIRYKQLVDKYELSDHVIFYGRKSGKELEEIYNKADIAVASLGLYKYGIDIISTLKTCEYFAKGLPVITGCKISLVKGELPPFVCEFSNDDSPINVSKVVEFYDTTVNCAAQNDIIKQIRAYAKESFDMEVVMKPIIDYIRS